VLEGRVRGAAHVARANLRESVDGLVRGDPEPFYAVHLRVQSGRRFAADSLEDEVDAEQTPCAVAQDREGGLPEPDGIPVVVPAAIAAVLDIDLAYDGQGTRTEPLG